MRDVAIRTVLLAVLLAGVTAARAQDTAKSAPPAPAPAAESAPAVDAGASKAPAATPPAGRPPPPTQQRFTPSEKVRADFPISFPIDI